MTRSEFEEWQSSLVTKEIMQGLKDQQQNVIQTLARSVGEDGKLDLLRRGYVLAVDDLLNVQYEEEKLEVSQETE